MEGQTARPQNVNLIISLGQEVTLRCSVMNVIVHKHANRPAHSLRHFISINACDKGKPESQVVA
eukprot:COSAG02_NODE_1209_length_13869_cov_5.683660_2_plen_64_part_00